MRFASAGSTLLFVNSTNVGFAVYMQGEFWARPANKHEWPEILCL